jgi:hypothetical protein
MHLYLNIKYFATVGLSNLPYLILTYVHAPFIIQCKICMGARENPQRERPEF